MKCNDCEEEAAFFHSSCCMAHFEGIVKDGEEYIACEICGKICGKLENKK